MIARSDAGWLSYYQHRRELAHVNPCALALDCIALIDEEAFCR